MADAETKKFKVLEKFELPSTIEGQGPRLVEVDEEVELTDEQATEFEGKVEPVEGADDEDSAKDTTA